MLLHHDRFKYIKNVARVLIVESGVGLQVSGASDLPFSIFLSFSTKIQKSNTTRMPLEKRKELNNFIKTIIIMSQSDQHIRGSTPRVCTVFSHKELWTVFTSSLVNVLSMDLYTTR